MAFSPGYAGPINSLGGYYMSMTIEAFFFRNTYLPAIQSYRIRSRTRRSILVELRLVFLRVCVSTKAICILHAVASVLSNLLKNVLRHNMPDYSGWKTLKPEGPMLAAAGVADPSLHQDESLRVHGYRKKP